MCLRTLFCAHFVFKAAMQKGGKRARSESDYEPSSEAEVEEDSGEETFEPSTSASSSSDVQVVVRKEKRKPPKHVKVTKDKKRKKKRRKKEKKKKGKEKEKGRREGKRKLKKSDSPEKDPAQGHTGTPLAGNRQTEKTTVVARLFAGTTGSICVAEDQLVIVLNLPAGNSGCFSVTHPHASKKKGMRVLRSM
jgi:hypothetical protein